MRKSNDQSIKEILETLMKKYRLNEKLTEVNISGSWKLIMGDLISKHTTKISLKRSILYLEFDSAALKNELLYAKEKMIKALNNHIGKEVVKEIKFR